MKGSKGNSADPDDNKVDHDQTPHHVASDHGLHCLLSGFSIKNRIEVRK